MDRPAGGWSGRRRARGLARVLAASALVSAVGLSLTAAGAAASTPRSKAAALTLPTLGHAYRHGAISRPTRPDRVRPDLQAAAVANAGQAGRPIKSLLRSGGGPVVSGSPKVYLVFWGSEWGSQSTVGGYKHYSGDPSGVAPELQAFYSGLGTDGEMWSAVATQYCQGVATFATACPASASHVAYPTADVLAGVWEDTSFTPPSGSPGDPTIPTVGGAHIAQEAANAAAHFGDSSIDAQFVIVSPTGTNPDGWLDPTTGFCAYHDHTADWAPQVTGADVAYTNMPYIPDIAATSCSSFTNPGPLDGLTETASHEYAETLTDPLPSLGWLDPHGQEIADKCAYLTLGQPGAAIDLTVATGTFDVQGLWANDSGKKGGCETSHSPVLLPSLGKRQVSVVGTPVSVAVGAFDILGRTLTFAASGLPAGLSIDSSTGVLSGTPTTKQHGTVTISASDGLGSSSVSTKWIVKKG